MNHVWFYSVQCRALQERKLGFSLSTRMDSSLGGQFGVAGRGEASAQVLEDVERQAAHQCDGRHFPQERHGGDEVHICHTQGERSGRLAVTSRCFSTNLFLYLKILLSKRVMFSQPGLFSCLL